MYSVRAASWHSFRLPMRIIYNSHHHNFSIMKKKNQGLDHLRGIPMRGSTKSTTETTNQAESQTEAFEGKLPVEVTPDFGGLMDHVSVSEGRTDIDSVRESLLQKNEEHVQQMKIMEEMREWQDYESHVEFELNLLRKRYVESPEPMTPERRAQMQAHLRAKQEEIMNEHAERAAQQFLYSLSDAEVEKLREELKGIDTSIEPEFELAGEGSDRDQEFREAMSNLSETIANLERAGITLDKYFDLKPYEISKKKR